MPVLTTPTGSMSIAWNLAVSDGAAFDAAWHDEQLAMTKGDVAVAQLDGQLAADDEKQLVGVVMGVPHELTIDLHNLNLVVVQPRHHLR